MTSRCIHDHCPVVSDIYVVSETAVVGDGDDDDDVVATVSAMPPMMKID